MQKSKPSIKFHKFIGWHYNNTINITKTVYEGSVQLQFSFSGILTTIHVQAKISNFTVNKDHSYHTVQ